mgnify:CR=1 FL=1
MNIVTLARLSRHGRFLCVLGIIFISGWIGTAPSRANQVGAVGQSSALGVARSSDNAEDWTAISRRLSAAGVDYRAIEWQQFDDPTDLAGIAVLFLPNIEHFNARQVIALETWVSEGGRLVVSGAIGTRSSLGVRRALRSLLGAYWAVPLDQSTSLQILGCRSQRLCDNDRAWVPTRATAGTAEGGVLIPTNLRSETVAVWETTGSSPAVVATDRVTFFGWQWGTGNAQAEAFDAAWLQATLDRYGQLPDTAPVVPIAIGGSTPASDPVDATPPQAQGVTDELTNPAEQTAAPGLRVEPGRRPIKNIEALTMRQELSELLGRVESALLAANAANRPINLAATGDGGEEADKRVPQSEGNDDARKAIAMARRVLQEFPEWVKNGDYAKARSDWLQARQLLWQHYPIDRDRAQPEIRAIWLDRGTIVAAGSKRELAKVFDRLASAGINTVFFETVNAGYPIYPSQVAPRQNPLTRHWDPLAAAVELAHERNMELHAWIWTFAVGNQRHNTLLGQPADYPGPVLATHPEWGNYDNQGRLRHLNSGKTFLDPANSQARRYVLRLIEEIATRYDVDGLQLDYIRYPFQDPSAERTYGYGQMARSLFEQRTGVDPTEISPRDRQLWKEWTAFRTHQVDSFVAEVSRLLRRTNPRLILSAAVFPQSEHDRIHKIQQHWEVWARQGYLDLIVPMTYALDTNRLQKLAQPLVTELPAEGTLIVPSVKLLDLSEVVAIDQIQAVRDLPTGGYALFAAEMLGDRLHGIFNRTQTPDANQPIPYRQPFETAAARYKALQREWSFLLEREQLWMGDAQREAWRSGAIALSEALDRLAANPSRQGLKSARDRLVAFEAQFDEWMRLHALQNSYQVQTWKHRLHTLDTLLHYGDRAVFARGIGEG